MGGAERVTRILAREAARSKLFKGIDIFVLAWSRSGTLDALELEGDVRLHYALAATTSRGLASMIRFLLARRYAFVFSSAVHVNAICSLMRRSRLLHTDWLVARESTPVFDRDFSRGLTRLSRMLYRLYGAHDVLVCQTERMLQSLSRETGGRLDAKLKVIPNPIDIERVETGRRTAPPPELRDIPSNRTRIVWCGRLSPVKSPTRAIEVLRVLHDSGVDQAHLIVIGDGPLRQKMAARALSSGLEDFVTFLNQQENPVSAMAGAQLGLVTSDVEGFPNVILEMLGAGIPAIATTDCAGELEQLPCTFVSPCTDAASIAQTALEALASQRLCDVQQFLAARSPAYVLRSMIDPCDEAAASAGER